MLPVSRADGHRGARALATDDARGLTVTGGLPYFGGPGNNYTTHGIATLTDLLREGTGAGTRLGAGHRARLVRHQARPRHLRVDPSPGRIPPGRHLSRPGGDRRRGGRRGRGAGRDPRRRRWWRPPSGATTTARRPAPRSSPGWPTGARWRWRRPTTRSLAAMGEPRHPRPRRRLRCRPGRRAALPSGRNADPPLRSSEGDHHVRTAPRPPGSHRDPHHQPPRGPQRHQPGHRHGAVGCPRRDRGRRRRLGRGADRRRRQGVLGRDGPEGVRHRRVPHHREGLRGHHQARLPEGPSSPRATARPWPAGARSC